MNKVILLGNLGQAPELKQTATGTAVVNFTVATNDVYYDKEGNKIESVEWHKIVVFGRQAETCAEYLDKGRKVVIEGSIRYRTWDKDDGTKGYVTEIAADKVQFLSTVAAA